MDSTEFKSLVTVSLQLTGQNMVNPQKIYINIKFITKNLYVGKNAGPKKRKIGLVI